MGFFSWNCKCCGKSIRSYYSTGKKDSWMREAVLVKGNGSVIIGEYDGYGRIDEHEIDWSEEEPCLYHRRCWEEAGKPTEYSPSDNAADQGFFIED